MTRRVRLILAVALGLAVGACAKRAATPGELSVQRYAVDVPGEVAAPRSSPGLVVASYNVRQMAKPQALRGDLAALAFVDVWAMQEVPVPQRSPADAAGRVERDAFRRSLASILPAGAWDVRAVAMNAGNRTGWTEGQLIASRLPIGDGDIWPLGGTGKRRAALAATIEHDGRAITVVNTDHEPGFFSAAPGNDAQVARLVRHLSRHRGPVVVAGDFNPVGLLWRLRSHPMDVARLRGTMRDAGFVAALHEDGDTFRGFPTRLRLDHLFLRGVRWTGGGIATTALGSDHLPVWCRVEPLPPEREDDACGGS